MKCLVVVPPVEDFYFTDHRFSCLGARIAEKQARTAGWESELLVLPLSGKPRKIPLATSLGHLASFIHSQEKGQSSFFTHYYRFGPSEEQSTWIILEKNPDLIFFSLFAFGYAGPLLALARQIKQIQPDLPLVVGGKGVKVNPRYFEDSARFDFLVIGEAEISVLAFLKSFEKKGPYDQVSGLVWKENSQWINNPLRLSRGEDLEPALAITYGSKRTLSASLSLTRGCTMGCRFCANHGDRSFRYPQEVRVMKLIKEELLPQVNDRKLLMNFEDDNLLLCPDFFINILKEIKYAIPEVVFLAENGIDYRLLGLEMAEKLVDLGFEKFNFTLGSFFQKTMSGERREHKIEHYKKLLAFFKKKQIQVLSYFIAGFKDDTPEKIAQTLNFLASQPTMLGMSAFYPIPGLPGFKDLNIFQNQAPELTLGSGFYPWNASLSTQTLVTAFRLTRFINLQKKKDKNKLEYEIVEKSLDESRLYSQFGHEIKAVPGLDSKLQTLFFLKLEG